MMQKTTSFDLDLLFHLTCAPHIQNNIESSKMTYIAHVATYKDFSFNLDSSASFDPVSPTCEKKHHIRNQHSANLENDFLLFLRLNSGCHNGFWWARITLLPDIGRIWRLRKQKYLPSWSFKFATNKARLQRRVVNKVSVEPANTFFSPLPLNKISVL